MICIAFSRDRSCDKFSVTETGHVICIRLLRDRSHDLHRVIEREVCDLCSVIEREVT